MYTQWQNVSMYSLWQNSNFNPNPDNLSTKQLIDGYNTKASKRCKRQGLSTLAPSTGQKDSSVLVQSSQWDKGTSEEDNGTVSDGFGTGKRTGDYVLSDKITASKYKVCPFNYILS